MADEERKIEEIEEEDEERKPTTEDLEEMILHHDVNGFRELFINTPDIDIAEAANDLEPKDLIWVFRAVESKYTAGFYDELNQEAKENLVKALTDKELVQLINAQSVDDVTDTISEMPANLASRVLKAADKDMRRDINQLLNYKDDTAGSIMTTEYLEFRDTTTVDDAIDEIRKRGKDAETIYTLFIKNAKREFVGTVDLDDLIFAKDDETLEDIMNQDIVYCQTSTDQEEVAQMFRRYDLNAMAVLNEDQRLVGIITVDDAVDVMTEEAQEDLAIVTHMAPSSKPYMETTAWENAKKSFPWLIALLVLGTFTTMVLNRLEAQDVFVKLPILIAFVPMLMDTGGNAGGQTTGLMIRGLAVKEFGPKQVLKILFKEFKSALIVAAVVASFVFLWLLVEQYTGIVNGVGPGLEGLNIWNGSCWSPEFAGYALRNAGLVSLTMLFAIVVSKVVGTLLPMGAAAIKKDPALLSQPLLTTIMDVATLMIYFAIAMAFHPI
jgi:magnesium transporter